MSDYYTAPTAIRTLQKIKLKQLSGTASAVENGFTQAELDVNPITLGLFSKSFQSAVYPAVATGYIITIPHGLGATPSFISVMAIISTTLSDDFFIASAGQDIDLSNSSIGYEAPYVTDAIATKINVRHYADSTNIYLRSPPNPTIVVCEPTEGPVLQNPGLAHPNGYIVRAWA